LKIGVLTGGGDSSAINAAIRAVVKRGEKDGHNVIGIRDGWAGLVENKLFSLKNADISHILYRGGTILGTSRTNPFKMNGGVDQVIATVRANNLEGIIAIGGDDTIGVAHKLNKLPEPIPAIGVPQTIDNDIAGTDYAIGFDTAMATATEAIERIHTTAESHHRVIVVEVMGRDAGHIALEAGIAGGADIILIPEEAIDISEVSSRLKAIQATGKRFAIVVVAEGATLSGGEQVVRTEKTDMFGHAMLGGIAEYLGEKIAESTGMETRFTILGHLQRGGNPTAFDRLIATRLGLGAIELVNQNKWDYMVCIQGNKVVYKSLDEALQVKQVDNNLYELAKKFD